ncbi:LysM peptidoglycan-binding domain-containing protein [Amycolatopsis sp.]|uniref:LysM peptidoglycan-binding domain-containing protein n=1 Tax=Amycolatopsis sp. TaxID=37632 RepID=UPI002BC86B44|nr:LysM peptidoglycan-binding domain-containing protein [Amycolatopsis sp.]HVV08632.1 LysM peptidoglycan-binding domain-containing protein [Amycolatopsis sp.]
MSVLLDGDPVTGHVTQERPHVHRPVRVRRPGETRRPPTRARVVAGRRRPQVPACAPRRVMPRWPWLAALAIAAALVITGLGVFAQGMSAAVPERTATVTVGQGQSLWDVARQYAPGSDADAVVARIEQLNSLSDAVVVPGLPLTVPVAAPAGS